MPDRYGFDHLGDQVRCVDCRIGGHRWEWNEQRRAQHHELEHQTDHDLDAQVRESAARTERRYRSGWYQATHAERICAYGHCSNTFIPERITRRYCSATCRQRATRKRRLGYLAKADS